MSCRMHYRYEYRDGIVIEGESSDYHMSAREFVEWRALRLKERGVPYTVDGLTLTYDNMQGLPEDLWSTVTLTWTDRPEEAMTDQKYKTAQIIGEHWAAEVVRPESPGLWLKCQGTDCKWEDSFYTDHARHLAELIHGNHDQA